jgi:hypothetical protein
MENLQQQKQKTKKKKQKKTPVQNSVKANGQYWFSDFIKLHNEKLQRMNTFIWVITPRRMRWERRVVHMGTGEKQRILVVRHDRNTVLERSRYIRAIILK